MVDKIQANLEEYRKLAADKVSFLQQLRNTVTKTESEITLLNGAIQACEKLLTDQNDTSGKTK
jgi:hypothetical protein